MKDTKSKNFYITLFSNVLILLGLVFLAIAFGPLVVDETWYLLKEAKKQDYSLEYKDLFKKKEPEEFVEDSLFARFLSSSTVVLKPVNTDFSLVIEKIGINVPVVANVSISDKYEYINALKNGVAHASTSPYPSTESGNVYIFAHASLDFWRLGKYSRVFNLLRKVELKDKIYVFYEGKIYTYEVVNKEFLPGWDTYPVKRAVIEPTLTIQTCDPPGTTINRLVVTSKLINVEEL